MTLEQRVVERLHKREYYYKNVEKLRSKSRLWGHNRVYKYDPMDKVYHRRRRAFLRQGPRLTVELIQQVYERNINLNKMLTCRCCHLPIKFGDDNLEHDLPVCRGGLHTLDNMDIAHKLCNQSKGIRTMVECIRDGLFMKVQELQV